MAKTAIGKYLDPISIYDSAPRLWDFVLLTVLLFYVIKKSFITARALREHAMGGAGKGLMGAVASAFGGEKKAREADNMLSFILALIMALGLMKYGNASLKFVFTIGILPGFAAFMLGMGIYGLMAGILGPERKGIAFGIAAFAGIGIFMAMRTAADFELMYILFWFLAIVVLVSIMKGAEGKAEDPNKALAGEIESLSRGTSGAGSAADRLSTSVGTAITDVGDAAQAEGKALQNARTGLQLAQQLTGTSVPDALVSDAYTAFLATAKSYRQFAGKLDTISKKLNDANTIRTDVETAEGIALAHFRTLPPPGPHAGEVRTLYADFQSKHDAFSKHVDAIFAVVGSEATAVTAFAGALRTKLTAFENSLTEFENLMKTLGGPGLKGVAKAMAKKIATAGMQPAVRQTQLNMLGQQLFTQLSDLVSSSEAKAGDLNHLHDMLSGLPQVVHAHRQYLTNFGARVDDLKKAILEAAAMGTKVDAADVEKNKLVVALSQAISSSEFLVSLLTPLSSLKKPSPGSDMSQWHSVTYATLKTAIIDADAKVDAAAKAAEKFLTDAQAINAPITVKSAATLVKNSLDSLLSSINTVQSETAAIDTNFAGLTGLLAVLPPPPSAAFVREEIQIIAWIDRMTSKVAEIKNELPDLKTDKTQLSGLNVKKEIAAALATP